MLRIDIADMYLRDQRALDILRERYNPKTQRAEILLFELARLLKCDPATVWRILRRLEGSGHIKKHPHRGRNGIDIEVLTFSDEQSTKTSTAR